MTLFFPEAGGIRLELQNTAKKRNETEQSVNQRSITNRFALDYMSFVIIISILNFIMEDWSEVFKKECLKGCNLECR